MSTGFISVLRKESRPVIRLISTDADCIETRSSTSLPNRTASVCRSAFSQRAGATKQQGGHFGSNQPDSQYRTSGASNPSSPAIQAKSTPVYGLQMTGIIHYTRILVICELY
jgi:hypothetical protein